MAVIQTSDLSVHLDSVVLNSFNIVLNVLQLSAELFDLLTFTVCFLTMLVGMHTLFAKNVFGLAKLVIKAFAHAVFLIEAALDIVELVLAVVDFTTGLVDAKTGLALVTGSVIGKHTEAVFGVADLFLNATNISVLYIFQVAKLLAERGNHYVSVANSCAGRARAASRAAVLNGASKTAARRSSLEACALAGAALNLRASLSTAPGALVGSNMPEAV